MNNWKEYGIAGMVGAAAFAVIGTLVSTVVSIVTKNKVGRIARVFDKTYDEMSKKDFSTDLSQEFIEKVGKEKIEREMERRLRDIKYEALKDADKSFREVIQQEINRQYNDTKGEVKRALTEKVEAIDISGLQREVAQEGKVLVAKKLEGEIDGIARSFAQNLQSTMSINKTISDYLNKH